MKILFFASDPNLSIGYSRIGNILTNYLSKAGHKIYYFAISNFKTNLIDRYIDPNITIIDALEEEKKLGNNELYGVNSICDQIEKIQPDILFLYNDIIVISRIFNNFIEKKIEKNFKIYTYLDLVYPYEKINLIKHVDLHSDLIFVFGEYWKKNLISIGINEDKIKILPHGFDDKIFFPIDNIDAKKYFNFNPDDFIILNTNRNNYRKAIDKTIDVFIKFLKIKNMDARIKLFLNMNTDADSFDNGYDINNQILINCIEQNINSDLVISNHIFIRNSLTNYTDAQLNILYNACNIGINTCVGEGFGLCNLEHAGIGKPQIISNVGGLSDIFNTDYSFPINPVERLYVNNQLDWHGGFIEICPTDKFVSALVSYFDDNELIKTHSKKSLEIITKKYNWDNILDELQNVIMND